LLILSNIYICYFICYLLYVKYNAFLLFMFVHKIVLDEDFVLITNYFIQFFIIELLIIKF